jgi:hypothetical protein
MTDASSANAADPASDANGDSLRAAPSVYFNPEREPFWSFYMAAPEASTPGLERRQKEAAEQIAARMGRPSPDFVARLPAWDEAAFEAWLGMARAAAEAGDRSRFAALLTDPIALHAQAGGQAEAQGYDLALFVLSGDPTDKLIEDLLDWEPGLACRPPRTDGEDLERGGHQWPLTMAVWHDYAAGALEPFLSRGGARARLDTSTALLHEAAEYCDAEAVRRALRHGASWLDLDGDGLTALDYACRAGFAEGVGLALRELGGFEGEEMERPALAAFVGAIRAKDAALADLALEMGARSWVQAAREKADPAEWTQDMAWQLFDLSAEELEEHSSPGERSRAIDAARDVWLLLLAEGLLPAASAEGLWLHAASAGAAAMGAPIALLGAEAAGFVPPEASQIFTAELCERLASAAEEVEERSWRSPGWRRLEALARSRHERSALARGLSDARERAPAFPEEPRLAAPKAPRPRL